MGDGGDQEIREGPGQGRGALITDGENLISVSVLLDDGLDFSDNAGVDTTAQTLIGGNGDQ